MFEEEVERRKIQYRYFVGFHRIMANIDRVRVEEILSNVVSNAIKYTGEGGRVDVEVRLTEKEDGHCLVTAVVKDTGIGISEEFLPDIFNSFERERNDLTNEIQGTGLGMGITKRLLDIMEGTIDIQSRLIVAMTANAFEEDRKQALEAGMNGFVSKPVEMDKMFEALIEVMG